MVDLRESQPFYVGKLNNVEVSLGLFWIGAPAVVMTLERLLLVVRGKILKLGFRRAAIFP